MSRSVTTPHILSPSRTMTLPMSLSFMLFAASRSGVVFGSVTGFFAMTSRTAPAMFQPPAAVRTACAIGVPVAVAGNTDGEPAHTQGLGGGSDAATCLELEARTAVRAHQGRAA